MQEVKTKLRAGRYLIPTTLYVEPSRIWIKTPYNKKLIEEFRMMETARWDPKKKMWHVKNCERNTFQFNYLMGNNPYARYEVDLVEFQSERKLYDHQYDLVKAALTFNHCIWAAEMGTGKTLAAIEVMESCKIKYNETDDKFWYVGPRAGVKAVGLELIKWVSNVRPEMMTYEGLTKRMKTWKNGNPAPRMVVFDESSKIKTATSQRSQAANHLAEAIRSEYGVDDSYIIEMTGTPAPKDPTDWWNQCEVACPGFLIEGNVHKLKKRLSIIEERESIAGGVYPHIVTWLDDKNKCSTCGQIILHHNHFEYHQKNIKRLKKQHAETGDEKFLPMIKNAEDMLLSSKIHQFKESINEVSKLHNRMIGLVTVKLKKDCLDLPEKQYEMIHVKPSVEILRAARLITKTAPRVIQALTLLRELSDGFQYKSTKVGIQECPECNGKKIINTITRDTEHDPLKPVVIEDTEYHKADITCPYCGGEGSIPKYERTEEEIGSPKDEVFVNELDMVEDVGRYITWAGFKASIDRLMNIAQKQGWAVLRVDGRGYLGIDALGEVLDADELLIAMDRSHPRYRELLEKYPKLLFLGHPQAGGMALTLTASPIELFYSNSFLGEARFQAEDRFHRPGLDENRGCTVKDIMYIASDKLVLDNINKKKALQSITLGELEGAFKNDN